MSLAVKDLLVSDEMFLGKVNKSMVKLRGLVLSARLRKFTPLPQKIRNITRCSSTYEMLKRYKQLQHHFSSLESIEIDELSSAPFQNRRIDRIIEDLEVFESVTEELQKDVTSISDVRAFLMQLSTNSHRRQAGWVLM